MNRITFKVIKKHKYDSGYESSLVNIFIDDIPLAKIMKAYEMPMATKEGHPDLAGGYHAIEVLSSLEKYYLGKDKADWGDEENKTALLGCECGTVGCWPLLCKISLQGNRLFGLSLSNLIERMTGIIRLSKVLCLKSSSILKL